MSLNPEYRYEGGKFGAVEVHVLYQPGDEKSWGGGIAVDRTQTALAWLDQLYGPFGWPQITNVHRIEGGGTEFPMMIHDGSADQGLIVHELGHNYTMGLLANNEWREGWLDEGFTSFQTTWFQEAMGRPSGYPGDEAEILDFDLDDVSEPPSLVGEAYRDFVSYNIAIYSRGELFFHQLRYVVGDETMHQILRTFYERWKYRHVDEAAFRSVAEEVSKRDLSTLFAQWLHSTVLYDYAVGRVKTRRAPPSSGGAAGWVTRVEVKREAPGRIPVEVAVIAEGDTALARTEGLAEREWVEIPTRTRPREVLVDPRVHAHDWNMLNNRKRLGFAPSMLIAPVPGSEIYFHPYFSTRSRRDHLTVGFQPTVWYNDAGGVTLGVRSRDDYLGRFEQNASWMSRSTGWGADDGVHDLDFRFRVRNPVWLQAPNTTQMLDVFNVEGRYGLTAAVERVHRAHLTFGPTYTDGITLKWVHPDDFRYLDRGYYENVGTVELATTGGVSTRAGAWQLAALSSIGGGLAYNRSGLAASGRTDLDPFYFRSTVEASARRPIGGQLGFAARMFAGVATGDHAAPKQRQIYLQGADPLEQLDNPFLRSRGAVLVGDDFRYQMPGGAGLRGMDSRASAPAVIALNVELERTLVTRKEARLFNRVAVAAFTDLAQSFGNSPQPLTGERARFLGDAGVGLRVDHRIGNTRFVTRFDLPLFVSRPTLAQDRAPGDDKVAFRWVFSFQPGL